MANAPTPIDYVQGTGPFLRLLQCWSCKSLEELPDFEGLPDDDLTLQHIDEKHGGTTQQPHSRTLHRIEQAVWDNRNLKLQIHERLWADTTGFKPEYYHTKNNLQEDAVKCFTAHHRSVPCIDFQDRSKRLGNPAARDRAALAREMRRDIGPGPELYLCNFCPVQQAVDQMKLALNSNHQF